ncbi:MAG: DUF3343 domain-containing protein [Clostridiales bacterium]|nr:DUF3343 domain-containing protein [Clostridiales bacterium]
MKESLFLFSSFYKGVYAQEKLRDAGIRTALKKAPVELARSCSYALYLAAEKLPEASRVLRRQNILWLGRYLVERENNRLVYRKIKEKGPQI